jgi:hypothetical protein
MRTLLFIFFLYLANHCFGQTKVDSILFHKYTREAILLNFPNYIKNNVEFQLRDLKNEFINQPSDIRLLYLTGYKNYRRGRSVQLAASILMISSIALLPKENRNLGYWVIIASTPISIIGFKISIKGRKQIESSVWLRNRNILSY